MQLTVNCSDLDFKTRTVVEYWRTNVPPCVHMSDSEILESILRYALENELSSIAKCVIDSKFIK